MKPLLPALAILALAVSTSFSQSVVNSSVIPCDALGGVIVCPDMPNPIPATKVTVVVRDAGNNPMPNVPVNLGFGSGAINVCPGAILSGVTNANGEAFLLLAAGGCDQNPSAAKIVANGIPLRTFVVKSPDFDGAGGDKSVNLADLASFSSGVPCHDYDNNGTVGLSDLIVFAQAFVNPAWCP